MDCRVFLGVFLVVLSVRAAPTDDFGVQNQHGIAKGPMILNEDDIEALLTAAQQSGAGLSFLTDVISRGPLALDEEDRDALLEGTKQGEESFHSLTRDEISHGPLALNEEDKKAMLEVTKQREEKQRLHTRDEISHGPLVLTEEDKKALSEVNHQLYQLNNENPGENAHGLLAGLLDSVHSVTEVMKRLLGKVEIHEGESHTAIEKLRSNYPGATDLCVRDVFGIPTRMHPVYCGVKYFSQVALGLYDMTQSIAPLKQNLQKLRTDLAGCKGKTVGEQFICTAQASRDAWDSSDHIRALLGRHLTIIRFLAIEINQCVKNNHAIQSNLVNRVALCASSSSA